MTVLLIAPIAVRFGVSCLEQARGRWSKTPAERIERLLRRQESCNTGPWLLTRGARTARATTATARPRPASSKATP
jgi:hypothetical protein